MLFREAGVTLAEIINLLNSADLDVTSLLFKRLGELNKEIESVKKQQDIIIKLLENSILYKNLKSIDENTWLAILNSAGINKETAEEWHSEFEKHSPLQHHNFLALLGFDENEIHLQREYYRNLSKR